jgi:hypothetical protein
MASKKTEEPVEEKQEETKQNIPTPKKEQKSAILRCRDFIKKLQKEYENDYIPDAVYTAFRSVTKPVDVESNYRKIWKETFKRS